MVVNGYALTWSISNNSGTVFLHFTTNQTVQVPVDSAGELAALGDILRNSREVDYEPTTQVLSTRVKSPGVA
jgi:hypothetical protein